MNVIMPEPNGIVTVPLSSEKCTETIIPVF